MARIGTTDSSSSAGQTCITPDYLPIDAKVKNRFLELIVNELKFFYGEDPAGSKDYCRMINSGKTIRMESLMKNGQIITGGSTNPEKCYVGRNARCSPGYWSHWSFTR